jgi:hypothetical protein
MKPWHFLSRRSGVAKGLLIASLTVGGFIAGFAYAAQPHMQAALAALQTARTELGMAEHNKGGHLPIAIQRVDEAIRQVQLGIQAGS